MAYSAVIDVQHLGAGKWTVLITETDAGTGDEAVITGLPTSASLLKQVCALTAGTGTTIDPIIGFQTNPAGISVLVENDAAAASVNNLASPAIPFSTNSGALYHRSKVDAGADNTILTRYLFKAGW